MALVPKPTRDADGSPFSILFDDADPSGLLPVAKFIDPVEAEFTNYPGVTPTDTLAVVDGTADYVITQTVITGTGASQVALAANPNRKAAGILSNGGAANNFHWNFFGSASTTNPTFTPNSAPVFFEAPLCPKTALSVIGTAGQTIVVWEAV